MKKVIVSFHCSLHLYIFCIFSIIPWTMYKFLIVILKHILTVFSSPSSHPHLQLFLGVVSKPHLLGIGIREVPLFRSLWHYSGEKKTFKKKLEFFRGLCCYQIWLIWGVSRCKWPRVFSNMVDCHMWVRDFFFFFFSQLRNTFFSNKKGGPGWHLRENEF